MRRLALVAATLAACSHGPSADRGEAGSAMHYISIGTDALPTARAVAATHHVELQGLETAGEVSILAVPDDELDELSHRMHEEHARCGGFIVHDSLDEARAALHVEARDGKPQLDYTIDHPEAVKAVLPALDPARILATIGELQAMKNRYYQSESGAEASRWLQKKWQSFTTRTDVTVELFDHGYAQKSVILTIPGATKPDEIVVLGGHLDSIARGGTASTAPGADDDASGIATLTEITRVLLASDYRPARTVQIMAYAAEEVGLRGSQGIVREYARTKQNVVGALQLDMTNYQGSDKDIWLMKDFTNAAQNTFLAQLIDTYVGATWGLDACGYGCSDHASWYRAGVPASMPFESRMRDRNMDIHTGKDTLEKSGNNAAHAVKFARLGAAYAIELAKGELGAAPPPSITAGAEGGHGWWKLVVGLGVGGGGGRGPAPPPPPPPPAARCRHHERECTEDDRAEARGVRRTAGEHQHGADADADRGEPREPPHARLARDRAGEGELGEGTEQEQRDDHARGVVQRSGHGDRREVPPDRRREPARNHAHGAAAKPPTRGSDSHVRPTRQDAGVCHGLTDR